MKNIFILLCLFLSNLTMAQTKYDVISIDTSALVPKYLVSYTNSTVDTVGVVITLKQAMKINNDYDILYLYKGLNIECDSTVNYLLQVVDNYKKANVMAELTINSCKDNNLILNKQVYNLKEQISISASRLIVKDSIITAKNGLIEVEKKKAKKYRKQRNIITIGAVAIIVANFFLLKS